jgi:hypothetical protein
VPRLPRASSGWRAASRSSSCRQTANQCAPICRRRRCWLPCNCVTLPFRPVQRPPRHIQARAMTRSVECMDVRIARGAQERAQNCV